MPKIDLFKQLKEDYAAPKKPVLVRIKPAQYLAISGQGAPGGDRFSACVGALYGMAYTIKMTRKFAGKQDYAVCKLEGQWFGDFAKAPQAEWRWKLLIRTPGFIGAPDLDQAAATLLKRGKAPAAPEVRLETIDEGQCVQMLHVGPYDREGDTIAVMQEFAEKHGWKLSGAHHEIYLSDPCRVAPEKLKTILRHPVAKA